MQALLNSVHTTYAPEVAEKKAAELTASDDWSYRAVHDPKGTGNSYIAIYDEDGEFVGKL
jgi:hypothetical protein